MLCAEHQHGFKACCVEQLDIIRMSNEKEIKPGMAVMAEQYRSQGYCFPVGSVPPAMAIEFHVRYMATQAAAKYTTA